MVANESVLLCAVAMAIVWTGIGWAIMLRLATSPIALLFAPALGFAVHSVIALPIFRLVGMGRSAVLAVTALCLGAAVAAICLHWPPVSEKGTQSQALSRLSLLLAVLLAALLAAVPAASVLPKATSDGVTLAASIFDHSKIAMIDEMARAGVPAQNPFIHEAGTPDRLAYYYLWHFAAAVFAVMMAASGWEADAALTWFTGFASLLVMIGLVVRLGAGQVAPLLVPVLAASASMRTALAWLFPQASAALLAPPSGLDGWLFQMAWAPQHLSAATSVVLSCLLLARLGAAGGWLAATLLGLVAAAGYQTSIWVGGVTFAGGAIAIALYRVVTLEPHRRATFGLQAAVAGGLTLALSLPFLLDQAAVAAARGGGFPIALGAVAVLGPGVPAGLRRLLDLPAYWLLYLPIEFAACYLAGLIGLFVELRRRDMLAAPLALLTMASLGIGWLLHSTVAWNNDLGWRAVLPALLLLVVFAATVLSHWPARPARLAGGLAAAGVLLALPFTLELTREDLFGSPTPSERAFARSPALWHAVQRQAKPNERVANNPAFLGDATPWPVNISWALLGNRRSCYAGDELAIAFAAAPAAARAATRARFERIFAGTPRDDDVREMAERNGCDVVVTVPGDGAWRHDPFAAGDLYQLVETREGNTPEESWRIYRRVQMPANQLKPRSSQ
jgi:hypothetical protein